MKTHERLTFFFCFARSNFKSDSFYYVDIYLVAHQRSEDNLIRMLLIQLVVQQPASVVSYLISYTFI